MEKQRGDTMANEEILLTIADIRQAAAEGVVSEAEAQRLVEWACSRPVGNGRAAPAVEAAKGFNVVTVAYYFGAMLMISACAWFLGDKWDQLGSAGVLATSLVYMAIAAAVGWWLRGNGFVVGGGLLITVAVCMTPLITYSIENLLGMWPAEHPGPYGEFYPLIHGSWIVIVSS